MAIRIALLVTALAASIGTGVCQMTDCSAIGIRTCGQCISRAGCAWCFQEDFQQNRCQPVSNLSMSMCSNMANPESSTVTLHLNQEVDTSVSLLSADLSLRVGDFRSFEVNVTPQRNLPLDLYILMDLSSSMNVELDTVKRVSSSIAQNISSITNNVRLGLGAFNDKLVQPFFVQPIDGVCTVASDCTTNSFAVRHIISLTNDSVAFEKTVQALNLTNNVDAPENGLEGLAQVIACQKDIGWREQVDNRGTRVILFMTDNDFHYAGEGRLAGILRPYNGECLLRENPESGFLEYTLYGEYDYPSVGEVLSLMRQYDVSTIFAVETTQRATYQALNDLLNTNILRSSIDSFTPALGQGENNEQAILNLILREYSRLVQDVSLSIDETNSAGDLNVEFNVLCPVNSTASEMRCRDVPFNVSVPFTVTVNLERCDPAEHGTIKTVKVMAASFGSFLINYRVICDCDCASSSFFEPSLCSGTGNRSCGVCECFNNTCGDDCAISLQGTTTLDCPHGPNGLICSGPDNGQCDCGCVCKPRPVPEEVITGPACECNNFECLDSHVNGSVCSGQGLCCNRQCRCFANNSGIIDMNTNAQTPKDLLYRHTGGLNHCQCPPARMVCFGGPKPGVECSEATGAQCGCNFCECGADNQGRYCELKRNDSCGYKADVDAILDCRKSLKEDSLPDVCTCSICNTSRPILFINRQEVSMINSATARSYYETIANMRLNALNDSDAVFQFHDDCTAAVEDGCLVNYVILTNATHTVIIAIRQRDCGSTKRSLLPFAVWYLPIIIFGCLLLIGIIVIVVIRIILTILDYIEVKRWQTEAKDADFSKNQNPLYQSPEQRYENVAYGRE